MMREGDPLLTELLVSTFPGNPAVTFAVGEGRGLERRQRALARFLESWCAGRGGIHRSTDGSGIMMAYDSARRRPLGDLADEVKLVWGAIGFSRLLQNWKRSRAIRREQKRWKRWIHCWYIGVAPGSRNGHAAQELRERLFRWSDTFGLPVLAETTLPQNRRVYERIGFVVYATVVVNDLTTWLMARVPNGASSDR